MDEERRPLSIDSIGVETVETSEGVKRVAVYNINYSDGTVERWRGMELIGLVNDKGEIIKNEEEQ